MSKKIVVISASPRKGGNSDTLCDEFIHGTPAMTNIITASIKSAATRMC